MRRPSLKSVVCTGAALSVGISGCSTSRYSGRSFAATYICALGCPGSAHEVRAQRTPRHASELCDLPDVCVDAARAQQRGIVEYNRRAL